ncbi:MAG: hypothetical protein ACQEQI_06550 [Bacillota bacterium]
MSKSQIKVIINELYNDIARSNGIISATNAQQKILAELGLRLDEDEVIDQLRNYPQLLPITVDQFICREYFEQLFTSVIIYKDSLVEARELIKDNYFVLKEIKVKELLEAVNPDFLDFLEGQGNGERLQVSKNDKLYSLQSEEDLIEFGLEYGYVSYEMVSEYINHYNLAEERRQYDISSLLVDKNIDYSSNDGEEIIKSNEQQKSFYVMQDVEYNRVNNPLLVDLRINQLLALLYLMQAEDEFKDKLVKSSVSKYQRDLVRLELIDSEKLVPTMRGKELSNDIIDLIYQFLDAQLISNLEDNNYSIKELCKSEPIKEIEKKSKFWNEAASCLRDHYLSLSTVRLFVNWIESVNRQGGDSMYDIFSYVIDNQCYRELRWLLVGDRPTSGKQPIRSKEDICFHCNNNFCFNEKELNIVNSDKQEYLFEMRNKKSKDLIQNISTDNFDKLKNPIYIKFLVPYNLVVRNKLFMRKIGLLKKDIEILYKENGAYCPIEDKWELDNDGLLV